MMKELAGLSVILAMAGGFIFPAYLIYRFTKSMLSRAPAKLRATSAVEETTIKITTVIGSILALIPGYFFSLMLGGYLGGGLGEQMSMRLGLGSNGVPCGILVGMTIYTSVVVCSGAVVGALLGKLFGVIISRTLMRQA